MTLRVLTVFGTRPEAIKMAPVVHALAGTAGVHSLVCVTAQHREMLDQVLEFFGILPDYDLNTMRKGQDLFDVTANVLLGMRQVLKTASPDVVLVHGDTTTCLSAALAAYYEGVRIGHVEAGLRTGNLKAPFPEEANRALVARLTDYHFAPTESTRSNLVRENIDPGSIFVTGNTVIDALLYACGIVAKMPVEQLLEYFPQHLLDRILDPGRKLILITGHRRENFGQGFVDLCSAIRQIAQSHTDWDLVYPVHLNPNVRKPVYEILGQLENVSLIDPLGYKPFVWLMNRCDLILTDSGGIQEEGPSLGKPVLVMREVTERPEAVTAGTVRLVGTSTSTIVGEVERLLMDQVSYQKMANATNPYGDGKAAQKIAVILGEHAHRAIAGTG